MYIKKNPGVTTTVLMKLERQLGKCFEFKREVRAISLFTEPFMDNPEWIAKVARRDGICGKTSAMHVPCKTIPRNV